MVKTYRTEELRWEITQLLQNFQDFLREVNTMSEFDNLNSLDLSKLILENI